jgi:hypothetical protein
VKLKPYLTKLAAFGLLAFALSQCANPMAPDGGEQDERPPQPVWEESSPNYQTNFQKEPIVLAFDEWVEINDPFNQIVISPPLQYRYELSIKKKSIVFEFDEREVLRDSATYTINFGEAIRDITERNPAENLRYVFATGPFIDSLSVSGKIVDAKTYKPVAEALFMLYENTADSVVRTERPFYFARTDDNGRFQIENVKAGTFKGFALLDNNLNYLFDQAQEAIGFPDTLLEVRAGSEPDVSVRLFTEQQPIRLLNDNDKQYGKVKLVFNQEPNGVQFDYEDVGHRQLLFEVNPDTTFAWYDLPAAASWNIYLQKDTLLNDTVKVAAREREAFLKNGKLELLKPPSRGIKPVGPVQLLFSQPLSAYDTALIKLYQDTSRTLVKAETAIDTSKGNRLLNLSHNWKAGLSYELLLLPGAVRDMFGLENDTISLPFNVDLPKSYGNLLLTVDSLSVDSAYFIQLVESEKVIESYPVQGQSFFSTELKLLKPGTYKIQVTEDWNGNGRWDAGHYDRYLQPEPFYTHEFEQLRANWDLEAQVDLRTLQSKAVQALAPPSKGGGPTPADGINADSLRQESMRKDQLPKSVRDRMKGN